MQIAKITSITTSLSLLLFTLGSFAETYRAKLVLHNTSLSDSIGYTVTVASSHTHASSSGGVISPGDQHPATIQFYRKSNYTLPAATISIFNNSTPQYLCKIILTVKRNTEFGYYETAFIIPANCVGLDVISPQPGTTVKKSSINVYLKTSATLAKPGKKLKIKK